jgi:hypothetical protein
VSSDLCQIAAVEGTNNNSIGRLNYKQLLQGLRFHFNFQKVVVGNRVYTQVRVRRVRGSSETDDKLHQPTLK